MGSIIQWVKTSSEYIHQGYLEAGANAIFCCLNEAGIKLDQVELLINTGVFPDNYIQEPAYAALLQGRLEEDCKTFDTRLFSCDIRDGVGGIIMALRIVDGFLTSGKIHWGLVVSGDTRWQDMHLDNIHFSDRASAILIGKGEAGSGFQRFARDTYPVYLKDYNSYTNYADGNLNTIINQSSTYPENCLKCAQISMSKFLKNAKLEMKDIDLLITTQSPAGFPSQLSQLYHTEGINFIDTEMELYSSGLGCALEIAFKNHNYLRTGRILFLTVGAGITVNLALYQNK